MKANLVQNDNFFAGKKLDLQFFATVLNTTESSGMNAEMKTFYEKRLIDQAEPKLIHDQFGDFYPIPLNGGKTIEFRKYDSLAKATTPLTEGVTPDGQSLNVSTITATLSQYGGWTPESDVLSMTAIDNNILNATKVLASQAGRTMDTITRDVLAGGTNVIYCSNVSSAGVETEVTARDDLDMTSMLTPNIFFRAAAQLGAMNADTVGDSFVAIIHPYAAYDLKCNQDFIDISKYANPEAIFTGEIGKLGNIRFVETSEAKIWKDDTCPTLTTGSGDDAVTSTLAVFGTLVLGAHAYGVTELEGGGLEHIVKQLGYGDDPLNQRASIGWKGLKCAERLVEQYMVRIESLSSYSATAAAN
ncbi:MAG: N4-gp56 family major capsid protein [Faecalibacterium sp.]